MKALTKVFVCGVYLALLVVCSIVFSSLCIGLQEAAVHWHDLAQWADFMIAALLLMSLMVGAVEWDKLWYLLLFFGCWASFLPPHRWRAHFAFALMALAAGLWASYSFQMFDWPVMPLKQAWRFYLPLSIWCRLRLRCLALMRW